MFLSQVLVKFLVIFYSHFKPRFQSKSKEEPFTQMTDSCDYTSSLLSHPNLLRQFCQDRLRFASSSSAFNNSYNNNSNSIKKDVFRLKMCYDVFWTFIEETKITIKSELIANWTKKYHLGKYWTVSVSSILFFLSILTSFWGALKLKTLLWQFF